MPELPEVETTRRGIAQHVEGRPHRRRPRARGAPALAGARRRAATRSPACASTAVERRAKYLLLRAARGTLMLHLGMSGSLRVVPDDTPPGTHDHVDVLLAGGECLRLRDPRRFGSIHWLEGADATHPLLAGLGPEPLDPAFDGDYLYRRARGRRRAVKEFIMDGRIVVGVGNIYAAEALFAAGIHPGRPAGRIARARYDRLAESVRATLAAAIEHGGTTLRDFTSADGAPGYFRIELAVYGRAGEPCRRCGRPLRSSTRGQRATVYCPRCQT
ncbi:MAG: bifunctional DNA-formamidopyrimidine glycosylase/DNA-(apurinic or apyrimidinic site) lyase [Halofilum sp. (in: g-proteobacteria)]|nr:bifunctional DNA-formamidopyrimidine glycosylase/DNA-(apurinic or apyrimidinic site) lyase [Halofilum sp. (in: g-proteobacteria)]